MILPQKYMTSGRMLYLFALLAVSTLGTFPAVESLLNSLVGLPVLASLLLGCLFALALSAGVPYNSMRREQIFNRMKREKNEKLLAVLAGKYRRAVWGVRFCSATTIVGMALTLTGAVNKAQNSNTLRELAISEIRRSQQENVSSRSSEEALNKFTEVIGRGIDESMRPRKNFAVGAASKAFEKGAENLKEMKKVEAQANDAKRSHIQNLFDKAEEFNEINIGNSIGSVCHVFISCFGIDQDEANPLTLYDRLMLILSFALSFVVGLFICRSTDKTGENVAEDLQELNPESSATAPDASGNVDFSAIQRNPEMVENLIRVRDIYLDKPDSTAEEVAQEVGVTRRTIQNYRAHLKNTGMLPS